MKRVRRGLVVTEETLAVELQLETGLRGDYLSHPHTLRAVRDGNEFLHKDLFDASGIRADYQDPLDGAQRRWRQILQDHRPAVSEAERQAVDRVVGSFPWGESD
jgi:trimethylamine:corrinoid methyltransferase-like protein